LDTPHINNFEGDSVLSKFVVYSPPSRSRLLRQWKRFSQKKVLAREIVHTLLLEEYGVLKEWVTVIIMDRRQDSNVTSPPTGKSGPLVQDRYCARGLGGGAKKQRANEGE